MNDGRCWDVAAHICWRGATGSSSLFLGGTLHSVRRRVDPYTASIHTQLRRSGGSLSVGAGTTIPWGSKPARGRCSS